LNAIATNMLQSFKMTFKIITIAIVFGMFQNVYCKHD
jgi:hypothetical protein